MGGKLMAKPKIISTMPTLRPLVPIKDTASWRLRFIGQGMLPRVDPVTVNLVLVMSPLGIKIKITT